jgi:Flp pilus assembly pilin Flp
MGCLVSYGVAWLADAWGSTGRRRAMHWWYWRSRGQGILEYSLIIALVVVVVLGTLILFGPQISSAFRTIENNL